MIYLSGKVGLGFPPMITPATRQTPRNGERWAADNGRYAAPEAYTDARYLGFLERRRAYADRCLFATAPDVWGDAEATLKLSLPMLARIRALGYPVALVAQDGLQVGSVPWNEIDVLFVGGSDPWRHSDGMRALVVEAQRRGLWTHLGRVNSRKRIRAAIALGFDSVDGTLLARDPARAPLLERWMREAKAQTVLGI